MLREPSPRHDDGPAAPRDMSWSKARKKLLELATRRAELDERARLAVRQAGPGGIDRTPAPPGVGLERPGAVRPRSLCVASGKGGTGKSVVTASLASLFAARGPTLIVDADMGVGNAHILQDVSPPRSFVDVAEGTASVAEIVVPCGAQLDLLAAGSGVPRMAELSAYELHLIATGLEGLELRYRHVLVDSAAGISRQTVRLARACDATLVVTTPDLTAMTDAYAFLKVLVATDPDARALLLVNRARGEDEALEVAERIRRVSRQFLGRAPSLVGWVPEDALVQECVNRRSAVATAEPQSPASYALRRVAVALLDELAGTHPGGLGRRLLRDVGYSSKLA